MNFFIIKKIKCGQYYFGSPRDVSGFIVFLEDESHIIYTIAAFIVCLISFATIMQTPISDLTNKYNITK